VWQYPTFVDYVADASIEKTVLKQEDARVPPARLFDSLEFMRKVFQKLNDGGGGSSLKTCFEDLLAALTDAADILRALPYRLQVYIYTTDIYVKNYIYSTVCRYIYIYIYIIPFEVYIYIYIYLIYI
jgi:hypothetical protein